jgi:hypothetical protein
MSMIDVLMTIPFAKIYNATVHNRQGIKQWKTIFADMPEAAQMEKIEQEYQQKRARVRDILARNPSPENIGDETIYHLVLREITSLLTEVNIGLTAVYLGHPVLGDRHVFIKPRRKTSAFRHGDSRRVPFSELLTF